MNACHHYGFSEEQTHVSVKVLLKPLTREDIFSTFASFFQENNIKVLIISYL